MGCCGTDSSKAEALPPPSFQKRKCTDILCLLLFICFIAGMIIISIFAYDEGNYRRIVNGVDLRGCTCDLSNIYDAGTQTCQEVDDGTPGSTELGSLEIFVQKQISGSTETVIFCGNECPAGFNTTEAQLVCYNQQGEFKIPPGDSVAAQQLWIAASTEFSTSDCGSGYRSKSFFGTCFPLEGPDSYTSVFEDVLSNERWVSFISSIDRAAYIILACSLIAAVTAYIYVISIGYCAKPITYIAIILIFAAQVVGGVLLLDHASDIKETYDESSSGSDKYKDDFDWQWSFYGGIAILVLAAIYVCIVAFMCKRINMALKAVKLAGKAMRATPAVVLLPVAIGFIGLGVCAAWLVMVVYLLSAGDVSTDPNTFAKDVDLDEPLQRALIYQLFGFFWVTQFLIAVVELSTAIVVAKWFFAPVVNGRSQRPSWPTCDGFCTTMRYHLGTVAFGSLIIALVKMVRVVLEYIDRKTKDAQNSCAKVVFCCCRCCLWCLEKCLRFINRQAYIQVALTGDGFCSSAQRAWGLITRNLARIGALTLVSTGVLFLGRILVAAVSALIGYAVLTQASRYADETKSTAVRNPFVPCFFIFVIAYFVGAIVLNVFETAIDTTLMCIIHEDEKPAEGGSALDYSTKQSVLDLNQEMEQKGIGTNYKGANNGTAPSPNRVTI